MNWYYKLHMVYKILLPVSVTLVLVLGLLAWQIQSKSSEIVQAVAERELTALGSRYSADVRKFIDATLNTAIDVADNIAYLEEQGQPLRREQIISLLAEASGSVDEIIGAGASLLPTPTDAQYANTPGSDENGQFYPYATSAGMRLLGKPELDEDYFSVPQKTKMAYISEPFRYEVNPGDGEEILATAGAPIIVNNVVTGGIIMDFQLTLLTEMTNNIQVYTTGDVSVVMQSGTFLAHRDPELVLKNMFELDRWRGNADLRNAVKEGKLYMNTASYDGVETFFYFHPIEFLQSGQIMYFILIVPMDEVLAEVAQLTTITLIASVTALIILLLIITIAVRSSVKPLALLAGFADEVSQGNFIKPDTHTFGGEVLALNNSLGIMIASLVENISKAEVMNKDAQEQTLKAQEAMREAEAARVAAEGAKREGMHAAANQLESVVNVISTASQQLSAQIEQSERASVAQARRVTETATAMEEMNCTVLEMAQSAGSASDMSAQARARADSGTKIVQGAVAGIEAVQTVSLALKEDMNTLASKAQSISKIMNVISDIADQTNLLALNAAIEAARAGDAGRGFAVVADEVRKLAEKTMTSTTDVANAIQSIQASVDASIRQVDKTVDLIATATEQSTQSGEALGEIVELVDTTADQVRYIATASEEQSVASEEINRAILEINDISEQSAQAMREAASAVEDLAIQAQALSRLVDEMKQG